MNGRSEGPAVLAELSRLLDCEPNPESIGDAVLAASPRPVVVWLDDVHHIKQSSALVDRLVACLPTNGHIVLVGREMPAVAAIRLGLEGKLLRLGEEELRFDLDEKAAFFHVRGLDADVEMATGASGWPAVMELELAAGGPGAVGYLTEEVLVDLSPDRLDALRRLSHAQLIDQPMIEAVTRFGGTVADLVAGLPLVTVSTGGTSATSGIEDGEPLDDNQPQVREAVLHDLLREALQAGLGEQERVATIAAVAGERLRRDDLAGATRRFVEIGDRAGIERVAKRLLDDLHVATEVGDRMVVVETVRDALGNDPMSLALHGVTMALTEPLRSEPILLQAVAEARVVGRTDLVASCTVRLADVAYNRGDQALLARLRDQLTELAASGEEAARRFQFLVETWHARLQGRDDEAVRILDTALAAGGASAIDDEMRSLALFYRTLTVAYQGQIREALAEVERLAPLLPPGLFADRLGGFVTILLWMVGEQTDEARARAALLVDRIEARGQLHLFVGGAATTAIFAASVGDMAAATQLVDRAERGSQSLPAGAWAHHSVAQARAVVELLSGNEWRAAEILDRAIPAGGPFVGLPSNIYGLTAALSYVLVPRVRPMWDDLNTGGDLAVRHQLALALVAFREQGDTAPAAALPWDQPHRLRPWAFEPHLAELAIAAIAGGNVDASAVLSDARHDPVAVLERLETAGDRQVSDAARKAIQATPRRPGDRIEIGLLGPLSVCRNDVEESDNASWRRARVRDLISLLAHKGSLTRKEAAFALWPDKGEKAGQNNLRSNLSHLLNALEPGRFGSAPSWFVRTSGDMLRLDGAEYLTIDVERFESHRAAALSMDADAPRLALAEHLRACELYRGDYLAGSGLDEYVYFDTLRLRGEFISSATRAADLLVSMAEPERAEELAMRASAVEPLNEPLQRALVSSLFAQRRFGAARDVLGNLLGELQQLQIPPEPETGLQAKRLQVAV